MIIHFSTVHPRADTRIRVKEVATLARVWPGRVALFVQDGKGDEADAGGGYVIRDTGAPERGRLRRMTLGAFRMYRAIRRARPAVAHFHDPELLPWAMLLQLRGVKVIYDMHEDLPSQLRHKAYLSPIFARGLGRVALFSEWLAVRLLSGVVVVSPVTQARLEQHGTLLLANYPSLAEFPDITADEPQETLGVFVYVGGMERVRGISEMIDAIARVPNLRARLHLLGAFSEPRLEAETEMRRGWERVEFMGWSSRETVVGELSRACAGLLLLHPTPQYAASYPVKLFEYMAAGLPVIASDFPLWREILEQARCGVLVDPQDPQAIADAMQWILDHPEEAAAMGRRGRAAVEDRYNWEAESEKLIALYERLLNTGQGTDS